MSIRRPAAFSLMAGFVAAGAVFAAASGASAQSNELQACAQQYQAAKADNKLNGQAWQDFYPECKARLASAEAPKAETAQPISAPVEQAPAPKIEAPAAASIEPAPPAPVAPTTSLRSRAPAHPAPVKKAQAHAERHDKKAGPGAGPTPH